MRDGLDGMNATLSTTNPTWAGLESTPGFRDEIPANNGLNLRVSFLEDCRLQMPDACQGNIDTVNT